MRSERAGNPATVTGPGTTAGAAAAGLAPAGAAAAGLGEAAGDVAGEGDPAGFAAGDAPAAGDADGDVATGVAGGGLPVPTGLVASGGLVSAFGVAPPPPPPHAASKPVAPAAPSRPSAERRLRRRDPRGIAVVEPSTEVGVTSEAAGSCFGRFAGVSDAERERRGSTSSSLGGTTRSVVRHRSTVGCPKAHTKATPSARAEPGGVGARACPIRGARGARQHGRAPAGAGTRGVSLRRTRYVRQFIRTLSGAGATWRAPSGTGELT